VEAWLTIEDSEAANADTSMSAELGKLLAWLQRNSRS
jgi:hypothetical protein